MSSTHDYYEHFKREWSRKPSRRLATPEQRQRRLARIRATLEEAGAIPPQEPEAEPAAEPGKDEQ